MHQTDGRPTMQMQGTRCPRGHGGGSWQPMVPATHRWATGDRRRYHPQPSKHSPIHIQMLRRRRDHPSGTKRGLKGVVVGFAASPPGPSQAWRSHTSSCGPPSPPLSDRASLKFFGCPVLFIFPEIWSCFQYKDTSACKRAWVWLIPGAPVDPRGSRGRGSRGASPIAAVSFSFGKRDRLADVHHQGKRKKVCGDPHPFLSPPRFEEFRPTKTRIRSLTRLVRR